MIHYTKIIAEKFLLSKNFAKHSPATFALQKHYILRKQRFSPVWYIKVAISSV